MEAENNLNNGQQVDKLLEKSLKSYNKKDLEKKLKEKYKKDLKYLLNKGKKL
jgi:hypothetical protein